VILTDREIRIAIDRELIRLDPNPDAESFSSTSVDLTLHDVASQFKPAVGAGAGVSVDPASEGFRFSAVFDLLTERISLAPMFLLVPRRLVLAWTRERLELPLTSRLAARVEGKSSLARLGVGIHITAPTIHAGFSGQIQLEVINHGPADVVLRPGMRICQLIFETTLGTPDKGYSGMFAGQRAG
jgi:dCTP deaminase